MDRYQIQLSGAKKYEVHDIKHGDNVVAFFFDFDLCKQVVDYLNKKAQLVDLLLTQASQDLDFEFSE